MGRRRRDHSQKSKRDTARVFIKLFSLFRNQPPFAPPSRPKADLYLFETFNSEEDYERQYVAVLPCKHLVTKMLGACMMCCAGG